MHLATQASSQAYHSNWRKQIFQMNITGLKIPTGGRQTSWLFTNMTEELNWGPPRNNSSLVVRAGLEPATSGFQVRRPNHSATLPPACTVVGSIIDRSAWTTTRRHCRSCKTRERVVQNDSSAWLPLLKLNITSLLRIFLRIKFWPRLVVEFSLFWAFCNFFPGRFF